ncbi:MAG: hypothetical protein SPG85_00290, partial [Collinsella sp.]|nr:hypothetical protein [Collinsella sp.]
VTMMYTAEIVSIDGDIACVRTYTDSYIPPYRSEQVTRSAYYKIRAILRSGCDARVSLRHACAQRVGQNNRE